MERRRWPRIPASIAAALSLCFPFRSALAEPKPEADRLFARGLQGMEAGDFPAACPALSESYRLDPLLGTLFTLAECERLARRSATALGHYEAFLAKVKALPPAERHRHKDREKVALQQRDVMSVVAPRLVLKLPLAAMDTRLRARVDLDGLEVPLASLGTSMRVDPGSHNVSVTTPDGVERSAVSVVEREEKIVDLALPRASPLIGVSAPQPPSAGAPIAAYVAGGVGAAGLLVGAVTGILAITKKSEVDAGCDANKRCSPAGKAAADALQSRALVSNIGFAVGAVGVGVSVVLLLTHRKDPPPRVGSAGLVPLLAVAGPRDAWIGIERSF